MKIIILILCCFSYNFTFAQHNIYPDTIKVKKGISSILLKDEQGSIFYKYYFDSEGRNTQKEGLDSLGNPRGQVFYSYNQSNIDTVTRYYMYSGWPSKWDSENPSCRIAYQYDDNLLSSLFWLDDDDFLSLRIDYSYDNKGRLIQERIEDFEKPGTISFRAFEPNTATFKDSIEVVKKSIRTKKYNYKNDLISVEYFVNSRLTGIEHRKLDSLGNMVERLISSDEKIELKENFIYNSKNREIEKRIFQTGVDGFGYGGDFACYDKHTTEYYTDGRIKLKKSYCGEDYVSTTYYQYQ